MNCRRIFLLISIFLFSTFAFCQQNKVDSLLLLVKHERFDTSKIFYLNKLSRAYNNVGNYDSAMFYANSSLALSNRLLEDPKNRPLTNSILKEKAASYNNIGIIYDNQSNFSEALKNYSISLKWREKIGDKSGQAASNNNIGIVYEEMGNYTEAIKYHYKSLKIYEALGDLDGIAASYSNMGNLFNDQSNNKEALKMHTKALQLRTTLKDTVGMGISYSNIGLVQSYISNFAEARRNLLLALQIKRANNDKRGIAICLNNIGLAYSNEARLEKDNRLKNQKFDSALVNYFDATLIQEEIEDFGSVGNSFNNIATIYIEKGNYQDAAKYLQKAKLFLLKVGSKYYLKTTYKYLAKLDSINGNYKGAFENHKLFILYSDSLDNEEVRRKTIQSQMAYEFEKKDAIANAEHKKELENQSALADEKSRKQKIVLFLVIGTLVLVIIFAGFILRSLRITRKQKSIIEEQKYIVEQQKQKVEEQKMIVEEHQKAVIDSITYAKRIQQSLLPTEKYIEKNISRLKESTTKAEE